MLILVGKQGAYKSSFLRFLAGSDTWFADNFNSVDGDKAFEKLRGMWIVEMSELQATKRAKDVESIKAFITSTIDTYRTPYERRTEQRPRQCVLAGTSNLLRAVLYLLKILLMISRPRIMSSYKHGVRL